jgi:AcrR family transcriptional regulator
MSEIGNKERIQQKAHDLFMEYGLRSVSMDDIANALGISKKTIYQFFADKDELVQAVLSDVITNNKIVAEGCVYLGKCRSRNLYRDGYDRGTLGV